MQGSDERIQNYTEKLIPARVQEDLVEKKPSMLARLRSAVIDRVSIEARVRSVLAGETTQAVDFVPYLSFALHVRKLQRRWGGGNSLILEVALAVSTWKLHGCTEVILSKIRDEVFAIPAPSTP